MKIAMPNAVLLPLLLSPTLLALPATARLYQSTNAWDEMVDVAAVASPASSPLPGADNRLLKGRSSASEKMTSPSKSMSKSMSKSKSMSDSAQKECRSYLPTLSGNAICSSGFDDGTICTKPEDIDPISGPCFKLPNCPAWCNSTTYCCNTEVIPGADISKYQTEFFNPPVLFDARDQKRATRENVLAVREFLQQILPESDGLPKTRVWGYGECSHFSYKF